MAKPRVEWEDGEEQMHLEWAQFPYEKAHKPPLAKHSEDETSLTYKPFQDLMVCTCMQASGVTLMCDFRCGVLPLNIPSSCLGTHVLVFSSEWRLSQVLRIWLWSTMRFSWAVYLTEHHPELARHFMLVFTRLFCNYLCLLPLRDCEHFQCEGCSSHLPPFWEFFGNKYSTQENYFKNSHVWLIVTCFSGFS